MSALSGSPRAVDGSGPRPSLFRLLAAVLAGECLGAVTLWVASVACAFLRLAPFGGAETRVWLPWKVDGVWALIGALGWGYLVSMLAARLVGEAIERRGYGRPAAGWLRIAIAVSGYGATAVGRTPGAHVFTAVIAGTVLTRFVAFNLDGSLRAWNWTLPRRARVAAASGALLVALFYSGTHSFAADGDGGTFTQGVIAAHVGHTDMIEVGLAHFWLPAKITGVDFTGPGAARLRASRLVLGSDSSLPYHLTGGQTLWISEYVRLAECGNATVNTLKLRYTILGISTGETIPLQDPLTLSCPG